MIGRSFGQELRLAPGLSRLERAYVRLFGVPVLGLRVRAGYVVPLLERLRVSDVESVADAGCGRGLFTAHCAKLFPRARVVGLDVDRAQVARNDEMARKLGRRAGLDNLGFEVCDLTELDVMAEHDLILSIDNLEHLEDDRDQVRRFHRALRPGGRLVIHVPHVTRKVLGWRRRNFMEIEGHVRPGYSREGLLEILEGAGFEIETSGYSYDSLETLANDLSFLITGGRERRKGLYAFAFPALLALASLGGRRSPAEGSGVWAVAQRPDRSGRGALSAPPADGRQGQGEQGEGEDQDA